ncbi:MAG: FAD-dependent oxidoreductase, partial [Chitinophagaceae bacterium]
LIKKDGNKVTGASFRNKDNTGSLKIKADMVIDGTELGDVFAAAGAAYDVGMDDPGISGEKEARQKNDIIQDLTWAAILKDYGPGADRTIVKPEGYDAKKYYCCNTDAPCNDKPWKGDKLKMLNYGKLPRSPGAKFDKYMLNWPAHGNDTYLNVVEKSSGERVKSYEQSKQYTLGFIYFMQTELGMKNIGLADDELDGGLALIPYNREGRRVKGMVRMNINHIKKPYDYTLYRTGISVGDYPVDHHHAQYPGNMLEIEFPHIPSYTIPLGVLIPEIIDGLIVCEKGISVTNIVNGTTRLQPVVLLTGQAAGVLAALSVKNKKKPRDVPVRMVQEELLIIKAYLIPFVDVKPNDPAWESIQKVGVTGILKGVGKSEGWANKMFFYPDSTIDEKIFKKDFKEFYPNITSSESNSLLTISDAISFLNFYSQSESKSKGIVIKEMDEVYEEEKRIWEKLGLTDYQPEKSILRRQLAVLLDKLANVFATKLIQDKAPQKN